MRIRFALAVLLLAASSAQAWSGEPEKPHHADLAEHALGMLEHDQARPIRAQLDAYRRGALDADIELAPQYHRYDPITGNGSAITYLNKAVPALRANHSVRDIGAEDARQLGIIVHVLFDLAQPLHTGTGTINAPHHAEYESAAYDHAPPLPTDRVQPTEANVSEIAIEIARTSARHANQLEALLREDGPWNASIATITNSTLSEGTLRVAQALAGILPAPAPAPPTPSPLPSPPPEVMPSATPSTTPEASANPLSPPPQGAQSADVGIVIPFPALLTALLGGAMALIVRHRKPPAIK